VCVAISRRHFFEGRNELSKFTAPEFPRAPTPKVQPTASLPYATAITFRERQSSHIVKTIEVNVQDSFITCPFEFPRGGNPVAIPRELDAPPAASFESVP
jgi:hypothetical protein